jgi:hypothetical protein
VERKVTFTCKKPAITVQMRLGRGAPMVSGGYGGWERIPRPREVSLTQWQGRDPLAIAIPVLMDGYMDDDSVELRLSRLERLALPHPNPGGEPPVIRIHGPIPRDNLQCVIENIEWVNAQRNDAGKIVRWEGVVRVVHYIAAVTVKQINAAAKNRGKKKKKPRRNQSVTSSLVLAHANQLIYVAKEGDTLSSIAARELGDWRLWQELADTNQIRDPSSIVAGQRIMMPDA